MNKKKKEKCFIRNLTMQLKHYSQLSLADFIEPLASNSSETLTSATLE